MKNFYIYIWYIKKTGEIFYVGKGKGNRYKNTSNRNKYFKNIYNKYDCDVKIINKNLSENEAFEMEIKLISHYKNLGMARANLTYGGEGCSGYKHSDNAKIKISKSNSGKNNPMYGIPSPLKGKKHSKNAIEKMKRNHSDFSGKNNPVYNKGYLFEGEKNSFYGKKHSLETREKMRRNHKKCCGKDNGRSKPISVYKDDKLLISFENRAQCVTWLIDNNYCNTIYAGKAAISRNINSTYKGIFFKG